MKPTLCFIILSLLTQASYSQEISSADESLQQPNILWITTEDHGPHLGAYGDPYAYTPNIDSFAQKSLRYNMVWSDAPVCAPARTSIITGVYPTSTGGHHMRSEVKLPDFISTLPTLLQQEGYYTTNNSKEDYNLLMDQQIWDESSENAHYLNRNEDQPFFAVYNLTKSHEYALRLRTETPHHDPNLAPVPSYYPNTPEVRRDWAQYYHGISEIDKKVGKILEELEKNNLAEETIVFFFADNGSGMPRQKRWPYNSGLHVPLIVHIPNKFRHLAPEDYEQGVSTDQPVAFVDLAPTLLSLINVNPPDWIQGRPFLGHYKNKPREFLYGFRGRIDERIDMVRSIRDDRYVYIRNYMPHLIYGQYLPYMFLTKTTRVWQSLYNKNALEPPKTYFWTPKPTEELYDLKNDPDEVINLAESDSHRGVLHKMRLALHKHLIKTRDVGFLPEAEMHRRAQGTTIYEMAHDHDLYPLSEIIEVANIASSRDLECLPKLVEALDHEDPATRYWGATGILIRGKEAFLLTRSNIREILNDDNPNVQIVAAEILIKYGTENEGERAINTLLELAPPHKNGIYVAIAALNVLSRLPDHRMKKIRTFIENMPQRDPNAPERPNAYGERLAHIILGENIYK